jgi:hypothetical protein
MAGLFLLAEFILIGKKGHEAQNYHIVKKDSLVPSIIIFAATIFCFGTSMLLEFIIPGKTSDSLLIIFMVNLGIVILLVSFASLFLFHISFDKNKK